MLKNAYFLLLASVPALANGSGAPEQCCEPLIPPEPIESCQIPVGYFYPAQYAFGNCGFDISLSGEFIYWEVNRDSTADLGGNNTVFDGGARIDQTKLTYHQGFRPGFKVAAAVGLPGCDAWELDVEYTWFHHATTNNFHAPEGGFISQAGLAGFVFPQLFGFSAQALRAHLKFDLDFIQGTIGRNFYLSKRLIVNASSGLKAWWSSLDSNLHYFAFQGPDLTFQTTSRLWGIGPYLNAHIKGLLWCGAYVYGKAGVWIPYTRYTTVKVETVAPSLGINNLEKVRGFVYTTQLMYEGGAGLGWGTYLCGCNYHLDFMIGYDMMTNYIKAVITAIGDPHYEFYYQGLSIKAQFDF